MWHLPGELHNVSLRLVRRIMHLVFLLPPRPYLTLRMLYTLAVFAYIVFIFQWRFAFNYNVIYDVVHDDVSRVLDLVNFIALIVGHSVVAQELLWRNHGDRIEQQFQQIRFVLRMQLGHQVNLERIQRYCRVIYTIISMRVALLLLITVYNCLTTSTSHLLICHLYSEMVLTLRCVEFSLYAMLVLAMYSELHEAGVGIVFRLETLPAEQQIDIRREVDRLVILQQLHQLLWKTQRDIETNFERSLIVVMMKSFVDTSVMPYWVYLNQTRLGTLAMQIYSSTEELAKLLEICIPCWICTRCDFLQRQLRSIFHGVSGNRRSEHLNAALLGISTQLGQERCRFSIGGLLIINNEMLGKFLFGMLSYFIICLQFWLVLTGQKLAEEVQENITEALLAQ
ncbi:hypothetical protein KR222_007570, partial [Zaprionus bogoriensis]